MAYKDYNLSTYCPYLNGTDDDSPGLLDWRNNYVWPWLVDHPTDTIRLTINSGSTVHPVSGDSVGSAPVLRPFYGIPRLHVIQYGATWTGGFFWGAGFTMVQDNLHQALTETVLAGATSATCVTHAEATSKFPSDGCYAMMTGYEMQARTGDASEPGLAGGSPPNFYWYEPVIITSRNASTGVVTFDRPLQHTYLDTWPTFNAGTGSEFYPGGPACLYFMPDYFVEHLYEGGTLTRGHTFAPGSDITLKNVTVLPPESRGYPIPTINGIIRYINCDLNPNEDEVWFDPYEVDKVIGTFFIWGGSWNVNIQHQSASTDTLIIGGNARISGVQGTAKSNIFVDPYQIQKADASAGNFYFGPMGFGRADSVYCQGGTQKNTLFGAVIEKGYHETGVDSVAGGWTMASGLITIPKTSMHDVGDDTQRWCVPESWCFWDSAAGGNNTAWQVTDVTEDATNMYVQTLGAGSTFPAITPLWITVHPCPDVTFDGVSGNSSATAINGRPARDPLGCDIASATNAISVATDNGVTAPTVPRSFLATL